MQARYYDPVIGRFYSNDPVGVRYVHSFNRYAYVNNTPYKYTDPTGKIAVAIAGSGASTIPIAGQNDISGQVARNKVIAKGVDGFIDDVIQKMEDIIGNNDEEILDIIRCKKDECIEEEVEKGGRICSASIARCTDKKVEEELERRRQQKGRTRSKRSTRKVRRTTGFRMKK